MFQIAREHEITLKAMILGALKDKYPSLRHHGRRPGRQAPPSLTLQLPFCFEVRALGDGLVSSAPEGPCDGVCGLNPLSIKSDGNAADFLD